MVVLTALLVRLMFCTLTLLEKGPVIREKTVGLGILTSNDRDRDAERLEHKRARKRDT